MNPATLAAAAAAASLLAAPAPAQTVTMDWVTIGNPGNAPDPTTGFGAVAYDYRIAATEVTNAQYTAFLNAVAASDPNGLYNPSMGSSARGGITRSGTAGSYVYTVKANFADKPVNFVSWYDAARMANWMTNGQGSGGTETGVYALTGPTSIAAINRNLSNPNQVFIPTENEWYKAAYHQPFARGGDTDDYWLYATQSNSAPTVASATTTGDVANPGQEVVNYATGADWNGLNGNVTTVRSTEGATFYGAFDMNGNIWEWNETAIGSNRGFRGGSWTSQAGNLEASAQFESNPGSPVFTQIGFRLATPVCSTDLDNSGVTDLPDLLTVLSAFASSDAGDTDNSGTTDLNDLLAVLSNFGNPCP